jgi:DNA-binding response OmpR family regulator
MFERPSSAWASALTGRSRAAHTLDQVQSSPPPALLVAEDVEDDLERLVVALAQSGFAVEGARNGGELLDLLDPVAPSLVVLEVDLPPLGGIEACRDVRARSDALILVISARQPHSDLVSVLDVGADGYLERVDRPRELVARVRALLRRRGVPLPAGAFHEAETRR